MKLHYCLTMFGLSSGRSELDQIAQEISAKVFQINKQSKHPLVTHESWT